MIFRGKQLIFRQMTQVLTITQLGNPILQQKAPEIDNFLDSDCQNLIDSLITTVQAAHGVGIAAPQVAQSLGLFIVFSPQSSLSRRSDDASHCADTFVII